MILYLRAGVYAEGPTDYGFLRPPLDRYLAELAADLFPGSHEVGDTEGIDAPPTKGGSRAERIAAAISHYADACNIFVIHADGAGDPEGARAMSVAPGITLARGAQGGREIAAVGCVPVREIEAWLLADPEAFQVLVGGREIALPAFPEKELDPKATLRKILKDARVRPGPESVYALFGERVRFDRLRLLPAFQAFEAEMLEAIHQVARAQGHPGGRGAGQHWR